MKCNYFTKSINRRDLIRASGCGFAQLALAGLAGSEVIANPLAQTPDRVSGLLNGKLVEGQFSHLEPTAKRVIFLFMWGGPSHVDLFEALTQVLSLRAVPNGATK